MKFGDNLRKLRKYKKISQEELAEKVNVSRQSVSKWETGDAYPEMNNILELCKIFKCNINDLVNDSIIDMDSLDEDVKMSVVKFKKEQQSKMKGLSKAISIIAKVCRIFVFIGIGLVGISMLVVPFIVNSFDVNENEISFKWSNDKIVITETAKDVSIKYKDMVIADESEISTLMKIKEVFDNNSKIMIIGYVECGFAILIVTLVLGSFTFNHLGQLFNNIYVGDTPFTLENVEHIKRMAYYLISLIALPYLGGSIFEILMGINLNVQFELFDLIQILFLFSMAYIFQYGYLIQIDSNGKMYGDEK